MILINWEVSFLIEIFFVAFDFRWLSLFVANFFVGWRLEPNVSHILMISVNFITFVWIWIVPKLVAGATDFLSMKLRSNQLRLDQRPNSLYRRTRQISIFNEFCQVPSWNIELQFQYWDILNFISTKFVLFFWFQMFY